MAPFGRNLGGAGYVCLNVNNLPRVATRNVTYGPKSNSRPADRKQVQRHSHTRYQV